MYAFASISGTIRIAREQTFHILFNKCVGGAHYPLSIYHCVCYKGWKGLLLRFHMKKCLGNEYSIKTILGLLRTFTIFENSNKNCLFIPCSIKNCYYTFYSRKKKLDEKEPFLLGECFSFASRGWGKINNHHNWNVVVLLINM